LLALLVFDIIDYLFIYVYTFVLPAFSYFWSFIFLL